VIAVSSGQGKLLRVSLELVDSCMETASSDVPLAVADADVFVKIQNQKSDPIINDWDSKKVDKNVDNNLSNIALQDDQSYYGKPVMSNGRYDASGIRTSSTSRDRFQNSRIHPHQVTIFTLHIFPYFLTQDKRLFYAKWRLANAKQIWANINLISANNLSQL
jgi:hypothetical protein